MRKLLCCLFPLVAGAQQPTRIVLKPAEATLDEEFTRVSSIRELADGRALITDSRGDARLLVADFKSGLVERLGRMGPGPREYLNPPRRLLALANDSTLLVSGDRPPRWSIMHESSIVETFPPESRAFLQAYDAIGADLAGNVLTRRPNYPRTKRPTQTRSVNSYDAVLANRRTGRVDTLTALAGDSYEVVGGSSFFQLAFSVPEAAMLFPDGWVAVVRLDPYRVDWRAPSGGWVRGPALPAKPVRVNQKEIDAYVRRSGSTSSRVPFAEFIPPLGGETPTPMPDGSIAIRRMAWSGAPETDYDIVNRTGVLVATLHLKETERIVGFGNGTVYIVARDADDLERLSKHRWP